MGLIRPVAVTGDAGSEALPDTPVFGENGIKNIDLYDWWVIFGAHTVPKNVIRRLDAEVRLAVKGADS